MSARFFKYFAFFTLCSFLGLPTTQANQTEYIDYQKVLMEERAWAGLTAKTLRIGDIVWSYNEGGRVDRPVLLFIHGVGTNKDIWNQVAKQLTSNYHIIAIDLPGSGSTITPKNFDLSLPHLSDQIRRFAESKHIENKLHIAGQSTGGSIALMYASQYPLDTRSLFLMSAGGIFKSNKTEYLNNPIYLKQLLITQPGDLSFVSKRVMFKAPFVPSLIQKQQEQAYIARSNDSSEFIHQLGKLNQQYTIDSFAQLLKNIAAPTLILWGKQDQIFNVDIAHELQTSIQKAERPILLDRVGHMPILEKPNEVAQYYLQFLDKMNSQTVSSSK